MADFISGLLGMGDEDPMQRAKNAGLLGLGASLLQAGAPSLTPQSLGAALGQGVMAGQQMSGQAMQQARQQQIQKEMMGTMSGAQGGDTAARIAQLQKMALLDPKNQAAYLKIAEQLQGKSPTFTGEVSNAAMALFGTNDVSKLTPEQRSQVMAAAEQAQLRRAQAGRTSIQNIVGGPSLSPFETERDKAFAKDAQEWMSGGGQDTTGQLAQLATVIRSLESGEPLTGAAVAIQPDLLLALTNPKALQTRELVEEVVQRNLRAVLGAQFTEKEGERLISRAFNPKLKPEENASRVRRLFLQMASSAQQKQAMVDYANKNGTLRGFQGKMPSMSDFFAAIEGGEPSAPPTRTAPTAPLAAPPVTPAAPVRRQRFNPATGQLEDM
jgi:hypothetical protein